MKRSIFCIFMVVCMMVSMLAMTIPTAAEDAAEESKTYIWDFSQAEIKDGVIATTGDDANALNWVEIKTKAQLAKTKDLDSYEPYQSDNTKRYAVGVNSELVKSIIENPEIYQEIDVGISFAEKEDGDNALVVIGGYFTLSEAIVLKSDKPWRLEINGRPSWMNDFLYNSQNKDSIYLRDGHPNNNFIKYYKAGVDSTPAMPADAAAANIRFGQNAKDGLFILENVYNETTGKWEMWVEIASSKGTGRWCYGTTIDDFTFDQIGSNSAAFMLSDCSGHKYVNYFNYIKVYEDINAATTVIESIDEGIIPTPTAGVAFKKVSGIDETTVNYTLGKIQWTDAAGESAGKAEVGTYTATVTLTPNMLYKFDADTTVVPEEYTTKTFNEDGTLTLTKTFTFEAEEDTTPAGGDDETTPADGGDDVTTPADGGNDVTTPADGDDKGGCKGTVVSGAVVVALACAAGFAFKKKED